MKQHGTLSNSKKLKDILVFYLSTEPGTLQFFPENTNRITTCPLLGAHKEPVPVCVLSHLFLAHKEPVPMCQFGTQGKTHGTVRTIPLVSLGS